MSEDTLLRAGETRVFAVAQGLRGSLHALCPARPERAEREALAHQRRELLRRQGGVCLPSCLP